MATTITTFVPTPRQEVELVTEKVTPILPILNRTACAPSSADMPVSSAIRASPTFNNLIDYPTGAIRILWYLLTRRTAASRSSSFHAAFANMLYEPMSGLTSMSCASARNATAPTNPPLGAEEHGDINEVLQSPELQCGNKHCGLLPTNHSDYHKLITCDNVFRVARLQA